ncbi:hypothetical protein ACFL2A_05360 [Thermodesulfobacteriota bacterium]
MILNLIGELKNFTPSDLSKLDSFLLRMQLKGELEATIIEIFKKGEEGLIELEGNKVRVTLPEGVRRGDTVKVRAEGTRTGNDLALRIAKNDKSVTINTHKKVVAKEELYHIKIPEKVDVKEVISGIKNEVINLKQTISKDNPLNKTIEKIDNLFDTKVIKITDETTTKELAGQIKRAVRDSGVNYERKISEFVSASESSKGVDSEKLNLLKEDVKYNINTLLNELHQSREAMINEKGLDEALGKLIRQVSSMSSQPLDKVDASTTKEVDLPVRFVEIIESFKNVIAASGKDALDVVNKGSDLLIKIFGSIKSAGVLSGEAIYKILDVVKGLQSTLLAAKESGVLSISSAGNAISQYDRLELKLIDFIKDIASTKSLLLGSESVSNELLAAAAKAPSAVPSPETIGAKVDSSQLLDKFGMQNKSDIDTLISELFKLKPENLEVNSERRDSAIKQLESMMKGFNKLIDAVEYQQLSNLKSADVSVNYLALPTMFGGNLELPEIVITKKKGKKRKGEGDESKIEIFVDLKNAGHIKADFSVTNNQIIGDFYCMESEAVQAVKNDLDELKESLMKRDFNVIRIGSKKCKRPELCTIEPEDKLLLEEINVFDFKV